MKAVILTLLVVIVSSTTPVAVLAQNNIQNNAQSITPTGSVASHLLSFANWKSQQITEADNRAVRLANKITLQKDNKDTNPSEINKIEVEYRVAKNAAQVVRDLTIEDYFNVYLNQFLREPGTLEAAAKSLTPQEVTLLLKMYLNSRDPGDQASNL